MRLAPTSIAILLVVTSSANACLWDRDTLRDERRGLPGVAEILAGKWERHSPFYYQHRVGQAKAILEQDETNLAAWDDLAVAYEKLGDVDQAIQTILKKDAIRPGEYTTHANLGTFYLHAGRLEEGIVHIRKALQINPAAHFNRERYQLMAAEYLLAARSDGNLLKQQTFVWPIIESSAARPGSTQPATLPADEAFENLRYALRRGGVPRKDIDAAIEGVTGMIRFGTGTSPHLYAALGDLLFARGDFHLAYRAYRRARDYGHPAQELLQQRQQWAKDSTEDQSEFADELIDAERQKAEQWVNAYQAFEDGLIRSGKNVTDESLFASFYAEHGTPRDSLAFSGGDLWQSLRRSPVPTIVAGASVALVLVLLMRAKRLRSTRASSATGCGAAN